MSNYIENFIDTFADKVSINYHSEIEQIKKIISQEKPGKAFNKIAEKIEKLRRPVKNILNEAVNVLHTVIENYYDDYYMMADEFITSVLLQDEFCINAVFGDEQYNLLMWAIMNQCEYAALKILDHPNLNIDLQTVSKMSSLFYAAK